MFIRSYARAVRVLSAAALLLVLASPAAQRASAQASDPRFFAQTNFRVDNDAFWDFFQHRGSVRTFGYPVSRQFKLDGFPVQIFQREVMQLWPDGSVHTLNLLDAGYQEYWSLDEAIWLHRYEPELDNVRAAMKIVGGKGGSGKPTGRKKRVMSAAARAKISKATKARWAKFRAAKAKGKH